MIKMTFQEYIVSKVVNSIRVSPPFTSLGWGPAAQPEAVFLTQRWYQLGAGSSPFMCPGRNTGDSVVTHCYTVFCCSSLHGSLPPSIVAGARLFQEHVASGQVVECSGSLGSKLSAVGISVMLLLSPVVLSTILSDKSSLSLTHTQIVYC